MGIDVGHFLHDAADTVGSVAKVVGKVASGVVSSVVDWYTWPYQVAYHIAQGQRIDKAAINGLHTAMHAARVLGPYVEAVVSFVPGIGTPVAAAIGGGLALAEGKPIDEVFLAATAGAIPGGVFVKDAYDIGKAAVEKKPMLQVIEEGVLDLASNLGVVIPDEAKDMLVHGLGLAQDTINGVALAASDVQKAVEMVPTPAQKALIQEAAKPGSKINVADVVIQSAIDSIPGADPKTKKEISNALAIGMAVSHAKNIQDEGKKVVTTPDAHQKLAHKAASLAEQDPVIASARANLAGQGIVGFDQGIALANTPGVTQAQLLAVRNSLGPAVAAVSVGEDKSEEYDIRPDRPHHRHRHHQAKYSYRHHHHVWSDDQLGFDTALALHLGRTRAKGPKTHLTYRQRAARALAIGAHHAPADVAGHILHTVSDPESRVGVREGHREVNKPFAWTLGATGLGLVLFGPVGAAIGGGLGYVLSSGGFFKE
jgi:hypothetical protein